MPDIDIKQPLDVVHYVQSKRMALLAGGDEPSTEYLTLMRDTAKTSMDELRIVVEEKGAKAKGELAAIMANIVMNNQNQANMSPNIMVVERVLDSNDLPDIELLPDETSTDATPIEYSSLYEDS